MNFARFFRTPILYMIIYVIQYRCSNKNLAKFTAKFIWKAASGISENRPCLLQPALQFFWCFAEVTVSQYLRYWAFPLRCSFQLILHWWIPNHNVLKLMTQHAQMITEVYLDVQTAVRGNFWTYSVWLTCLKCCIRAWRGVNNKRN